MTIRNELIRTARSARPVLAEAAWAQVLRFLDTRRVGGGFSGRSDTPRADLYYTVFGLQAWLALDGTQRRRDAEKEGEKGGERLAAELAPRSDVASLPLQVLPVDPAFLNSFGGGDKLDFVHTCCLIRCWACLGGLMPRPGEEVVQALRARLISFRLADGGYNHAGADRDSAYGCFLALGALQDLTDWGLPAEAKETSGLAGCLDHLHCPGGGYANPPSQAPSAPATAAALVVLRHLGRPADSESARWLLTCRGPDGGFRANELAPIGDLLSTATSLHALVSCGEDLGGIREQTLNFLDSLWSPKGGFRGNALDAALDCEYAFYGLLALGCLA